MNIKTFLYIITLVISIYALDGINIKNVFKTNHIMQAKLIYLLTSIALSYLTTNFIYDFITNCKII